MGNNICCIDPPHRKYREMSDMELEFEKKEVEKKKKWDLIYAGGYGLSIVVPTIVVICGGPITVLLGVGISTIGLIFYVLDYSNNNIRKITIDKEFENRNESNIIKIKKTDIIQIS